MKRIRWVLLAVFLAVCGLLLLSANFHVARSTTNSNSQFTRASSHRDTTLNKTDTRRIFLHVENRVGLASALAWEVRRLLRESGQFDPVLLNNAPEADDYPLLVVGIRDKHLLWTPFYGRASFKVVVCYASYTSDVSLDKQESVTFDGSDAQGDLPIRVQGSIEATDSTVGLISLPAYRRLLTIKPAHDIVDYLEKAIEDVRKDASKVANTPG